MNLRIPGLPPLPYRISADFEDEASKRTHYTPFLKEGGLGYIVDRRDLHPKTRLDKEAEISDAETPGDYLESPLAERVLIIALDPSSISDSHIVQKENTPDGLTYTFIPSVSQVLENIRIQVEVEDMRLEGSPVIDSSDMRGEYYGYAAFYPQDTGPLPTGRREVEQGSIVLDNGLGIYLPSDYSLLGSIRARFVLDVPSQIETK